MHLNASTMSTKLWQRTMYCRIGLGCISYYFIARMETFHEKNVTDMHVGESFRLEIANAATFSIVLALSQIELLKLSE